MTDDALSRMLPASAGEGPDGRLTIAQWAVADIATATLVAGGMVTVPRAVSVKRSTRTSVSVAEGR